MTLALDLTVLICILIARGLLFGLRAFRTGLLRAVRALLDIPA
jgi:hypothetical protein